MDKEELEYKVPDLLATTLGTATGLIPIIGGPISELIKLIIPNQREERIINFIKDLDDKIIEMKISLDDLKLKFSDKIYGAFLYECCRGTVNEIYEEKVKYYKEIFISGIIGEKNNIFNMDYILSILLKLKYPEILYLKYYYYVDFANREEMESILKQLGYIYINPTYMGGMERSKMNAETYKQIIINNLLQNDLLKVEYDKNGKAKNKISMVGKLFLKEIGEINE